jgi:hypothetical protein
MAKTHPYGGRRRREEPWPHGQPVIVCPSCLGTGMDRAHAAIYQATRAPLEDEARADAVRCAACEGRGRQTVAHALAQGFSVRG